MKLNMALLCLILLGCQPRNELPAALGELKLVERIDGEQAKHVINRLHDKGVTPEANFIGRYGNEERSATLYLSVFGSGENAVEAERIMAELIKKGNPVFGHYHEFLQSGKQLAMCLGQGQAHYFFSHKSNLYWLAVDAPIAQESLQNLLNEVVSEH
jgi:hypothetical protein